MITFEESRRRTECAVLIIYPFKVTTEDPNAFSKMEAVFGRLLSQDFDGALHNGWLCNDRWTFLETNIFYFKTEEDAVMCKMLFG